jgi:two-component system, sensor histidine kinase YesM
MINRFKNLSIGRAIFLVTTTIVGIIMLLSTTLTYQLIFARTDALIESTSKEINKQVVMNYENYLSNVIDTSNSLQKYILELTKASEMDNLENLFIATLNIERNIENIVLLDLSGRPIVSSTNEEISDGIISRSWFIEARNNADIHHFSSSHIEDIVANGTTEVFSVSRSIYYYDEGVQKEGVLLIDIDTSNLKALAAQTNLGNQGHIIITNQGNELIYSSLPECTSDVCESTRIANDIVLGGKLVTLDNMAMFVNVNTIKYTRWNIATFINVNDITNSKTDTLYRVILIFLGTLIAIAISSAVFSMRISKPMNQLKEHIHLIQEGDFDTMVQVEGQREVVVLADAFNSMSNRIKELMQRVLKEQVEKRKTHFVALQNQINPHFLYNTLDSIVWLSENNRNKDVEKAIIALSKFFRMSISDQMSTVQLKDEVEHVRNYLLIQQIRYQHSFKFEFDIDKEIENNYVLKLSLQPLVENAIIHGIRPEESFTKILIKGYQKDGFTFIEVFNEGYGMTQQRIDDIVAMIRGEKESESMGLKNVYQRLKLYYGLDADLFIESELDEYTKVTMKIPNGQEAQL